MSYRRKAPATKTLSLTQQLSKLVNISALGVPFQVHNSLALLTQMKKIDEGSFQNFEKRAEVQGFVPSWRTEPGDLKPDAKLYSLPLPKYFIDPNDSAEALERRTFYHVKSVKNESLAKASSYAPRCGLTGLFYSREEVVDNLQAAAHNLGFTSPFWIQSNHPSLESGYLKIKEGSESICIGLTSSIISVEDVEPFDLSILHPSIRGEKTLTKVAAAVPTGTNVFTKFESKNPFLVSLPLNGLWMTHEQLLQNNLKITRGKKRPTKEGPLYLVETEQWELYNADQLTVPGRLGLKQCLASSHNNPVFSPA